MRIIDAHLHYFSRPFFETLAGLSPQDGDVESRLAAVSSRTGIELPSGNDDEHLARWNAEFDAGGVERAFAFASLPQEVPTVSAAAKAADGRLAPVALVNPAMEGAGAKTAELLAGGFAGVLCFPAMHHFAIAGDAARPVLEALSEKSAVIYVHCGQLVVKLRDLLGLQRTYDLSFANPLDIVPAADAFPNVRFIIPHFGAGFFRETLIAGAQCANIFVDTSSSHSWMKTQASAMTLKDVFGRALDVFGPERILFGTDSGVFPAGWRKDRFDEQRAVLEELGVSSSEQQRVFAENAADFWPS
jgi:hypothetical protein